MRQPSYGSYANDGIEKGTILNSWSRPIAGWSLECESDGYDRVDAYKNIYSQKFNSKALI